MDEFDYEEIAKTNTIIKACQKKVKWDLTKQSSKVIKKHGSTVSFKGTSQGKIVVERVEKGNI